MLLTGYLRFIIDSVWAQPETSEERHSDPGIGCPDRFEPAEPHRSNYPVCAHTLHFTGLGHPTKGTVCDRGKDLQDLITLGREEHTTLVLDEVWLLALTWTLNADD